VRIANWIDGSTLLSDIKRVLSKVDPNPE